MALAPAFTTPSFTLPSPVLNSALPLDPKLVGEDVWSVEVAGAAVAAAFFLRRENIGEIKGNGCAKKPAIVSMQVELNRL